MPEPLIALCATLLSVGYALYRYGPVLSNDGGTYLLAAGGLPVASPFRWRLLPRLFGALVRSKPRQGMALPEVQQWATKDARRVLFTWSALSVLAVIASGPLLYWLTGSLIAVLLWSALPWVKINVRWTLQTDQLAFVLAIGSALALQRGWFWLALALSVAAGACHERAPVFVALWAWSVWPLVGLAIPALLFAVAKRGPIQVWERGIVDAPLASARRLHSSLPMWRWIAPWGAAALAVAAPTAQLVVTLVVAYAQSLIASDRVRLYQWAAPVVCLQASEALVSLAPVAIAAVVMLHWCNPFAEAQS